jgi:hypothetical protein
MLLTLVLLVHIAIVVVHLGGQSALICVVLAGPGKRGPGANSGGVLLPLNEMETLRARTDDVVPYTLDGTAQVPRAGVRRLRPLIVPSTPRGPRNYLGTCVSDPVRHADS